MITYSADVDILYVQLSDAPVAGTEVVDDARFVDYDADGGVVGVEILGASQGVDLRDLPERERLEAAVKVLTFPVYV